VSLDNSISNNHPPLPDAAEGHDSQQIDDPLNHLHHSLRESFVSLPCKESKLTEEQLRAVFGGDWRALRDIAQLAYEITDCEPE
jgi:hypothetical protein